MTESEFGADVVSACPAMTDHGYIFSNATLNKEMLVDVREQIEGLLTNFGRCLSRKAECYEAFCAV